ncbi:MAG: helix-turn-helix domain-containing protein [Deltaproteobacteria bacterium]|nr:helix-turn-helix domain-containing protein [Deltaproteobacteria bacterium]
MSENVTHNADPAASSPGAILKRCREYHGISLGEAAEATKIGINYLRALEGDQIKEIPSAAYRRGFLRIYATYLGLNPDDIIRFSEKQSSPAGAPRKDLPGGKGDGMPVRSRFSWRKLLLPALLLLLLIVTASIINRPTAPPPKQAVPQPVAEAPAAPPVLPALSSARPASPVQKPEAKIAPAKPASDDTAPSEPGVTLTQPPEAPKGFIVRMKVIQNGTLTVAIDGVTAQNYDLAVGDIIEWKAAKNITLELSNAGGVEAELNGKPLKAFGPAGKPAYIELDANGVKE